jgi:hypothetical protein
LGLKDNKLNKGKKILEDEDKTGREFWISEKGKLLFEGGKNNNTFSSNEHEFLIEERKEADNCELELIDFIQFNNHFVMFAKKARILYKKYKKKKKKII